MKRTEVREQLQALIGEREPGDAMPSERTLSEQLGVSRPTVRAAIEELARAGLLVRQHGRGTFTSPLKISQELASASGGFAALPAEGEWRSRVVDFRIELAGARLGQRLQISPGNELVQAVRLRLVDGSPMAIENIRLPHAVVPGISAADFENGSLYDHLRTRFEVIPATAVQVTEPTVTDADEARLLGVPLHSPALMFDRTTRDRTGRVIEYTHSIYRGDRYRLTTHLVLDRNSG